MRPRFFLVSIALLVSSLLGMKSTWAVESTKPLNLLIITADDMNADSAGWNGCSLNVTPNLDTFAKSAHRFINAHVTVPICQPGRSALMTGRVPHRNGALGFNPIRRDVPTLVEILRDRGYYTAAIAKAVHMAPADKFPWHEIGEQSLGKQPMEFAASLRGMLEHAAEKKMPFFINSNICDPHRPFINVKNQKRKNTEQLDGVRIIHPEEVTVPAFLEDLSAVRDEVAQYYSNVSRLDVTFGLIMKELKAQGRDADTIVVFMSDHGMSFPFSKATVYRNGTWSPVLIRIPGMENPAEHPEFVSSVDVMPSLLELMGFEQPTGMDGRSWVPLLKGQSQTDRDFVVTHVNTVSSGKSFAQRCIRTKDRSLMFHAWCGKDTFRVEAMSGLSFQAMKTSMDERIRARVEQLTVGETWMFFDTQADPSERQNLIRDPKYAAEVKQLLQKLLTHMKQTDDPLLPQIELAIQELQH